jgi:hypothetical protein
MIYSAWTVQIFIKHRSADLELPDTPKRPNISAIKNPDKGTLAYGFVCSNTFIKYDTCFPSLPPRMLLILSTFKITSIG